MPRSGLIEFSHSSRWHMNLRHHQIQPLTGSRTTQTLRTLLGRCQDSVKIVLIQLFLVVVERPEEADIPFVFGEHCQEFFFLRCDLRTWIENNWERSRGTQGVTRVTDQFGPVPQDSSALKTWDGQSDDCASCTNDLHR